jgi:hypothetical protein
MYENSSKIDERIKTDNRKAASKEVLLNVKKDLNNRTREGNWTYLMAILKISPVYAS